MSVLSSSVNGQAAAGGKASYELRNLIDIPTAGVLEAGNLGVVFDILPLGVFITKIELALFNNFSLGISYGGSNLIGSGEPNWYNNPGYHAKFRIFTETRSLPSLSFGFDSQGKGLFIDSLNRYEIKSPGGYLATSKNFKLLGYISFHGLVNYSLENNDGDDNINFGFGIEKSIGPTVSFIAEYNLALNDNSSQSFGDGKGYLNLGLRWSASYGLTIGLDFRNLLDNKKSDITNGFDRSLFIEFVRNLF